MRALRNCQEEHVQPSIAFWRHLFRLLVDRFAARFRADCFLENVDAPVCFTFFRIEPEPAWA
jgi:hypothetical protein